jgi:hypothetical protein
MERVTGIEPALSAREFDRSGSLTAVTWASEVPLVTAIDPAIPTLMTPMARGRSCQARIGTWPSRLCANPTQLIFILRDSPMTARGWNMGIDRRAEMQECRSCHRATVHGSIGSGMPGSAWWGVTMLRPVMGRSGEPLDMTPVTPRCIVWATSAQVWRSISFRLAGTAELPCLIQPCFERVIPSP